jgi:hypothetical protein
VLGRISARYGRIPSVSLLPLLPHSRLRALGGTSTARGLAAAVLAVAALIAAADAGPARAAQDSRPASHSAPHTAHH